MSVAQLTPREIAQAIRNVPDFPKAGVQFKDITPVLADSRLFAGTVELLTSHFQPGEVDAVVGIDARGFIFAAAAAAALVGRLGGTILEAAFVIELTFLEGRAKLPGLPIHSLVTY